MTATSSILGAVERYATCALAGDQKATQVATCTLHAALSDVPAIAADIENLAQLYVSNLMQGANSQACIARDQITNILKLTMRQAGKQTSHA